LAAGTLAVFIASTPLVTLILAVLHGQERFTTRGLLGGALAIAGISVISVDTLGGDLRPIYLIAALAAVVAVSESSVVVKSFPRSDPITTNAVGMSVGAALLLISSFVLREDWIVPREPTTWIVLAWLTIAGSVGLFVLFLYVLKRWTASATGYALTLMPIVAITLGALLADEEISTQLLLGGGLVMTAVYVGALSDTTARVPAVEASPKPG
jgi:drug/metabolite transporter (DMT)-like permease